METTSKVTSLSDQSDSITDSQVGRGDGAMFEWQTGTGWCLGEGEEALEPGEK